MTLLVPEIDRQPLYEVAEEVPEAPQLPELLAACYS